MLNVQFSVIVACYNPDIEKLKKTLISIEKQRDVSFEVIITDDGSKLDYRDEIDAWIKSKGFQNIQLNFLATNQGTIDNIISGLRLCSGKFVKIISPGDFLYDETSLKNYLNVFLSNSADIVFGRAVYYTSERKIISSISTHDKTVYLKNKRIRKNLLLYCDFILGASIATTRDVLTCYLNEVEGKVFYLEDLSLTMLALIDNKKIFATNQYVVWYEYGEGSSTKEGGSPLVKQDTCRFFNYLKERSKNKKLERKVVNLYSLYHTHSRFKRWLGYLFSAPGYFAYRIRCRLTSSTSKRELKSINLQDMDKITTL